MHDGGSSGHWDGHLRTCTTLVNRLAASVSRLCRNRLQEYMLGIFLTFETKIFLSWILRGEFGNPVFQSFCVAP